MTYEGPNVTMSIRKPSEQLLLNKQLLLLSIRLLVSVTSSMTLTFSFYFIRGYNNYSNTNTIN